jgi:hypothetical protein
VPKAPHPPSAFKTNNPTFATLMAKLWARPEEVVYVFSSETEQLELTETQYKEIMKQIQGQALDCQIAGTQVPKYRWSGYSLHSDKGYIAVDFDDVERIIKAVASIVIEGVKFRAWRTSEMQVKHLVTAEIEPSLAANGVVKIIQGMIKVNDLRGGSVIEAWILDGESPNIKVLRFFVDPELCEKILERRRNDKGRRLFLYIGSQYTPVRVSALPGAGLGDKDKAEVAAFKDANDKAEGLIADRKRKENDMEEQETEKPANDWTKTMLKPSTSE